MYLPSHSYVYAYLRLDGTPYYIGKGKGKRAWVKGRVIKPPTDTNRIVIVAQGLTDLGALALERRLIRWYGRIDVEYSDRPAGTLRNMTDGGDGAAGLIVTESTRQKMSCALKGKPKPAGFSEICRARIAGDKNHQYGKPGTRLGVKESAEQRQAKSDRYLNAPHPMVGSFWINNGHDNRKLVSGESIPDGWHKGRHFTVNPRYGKNVLSVDPLS